MIDFINLKHQQELINKKIHERIEKVLRHGNFILGPEVQELEEKLSAFVGTKYCITVANGTEAILLALMSIDILPGDEIIIPDFNYIAAAEAAAILNAKPVFADVCPRTFNLNIETIEEKITGKTKAIIPTSLFGQCPDIDKINDLAERYNLTVIEDAAQSFGATYKGKRSCSLTKISCTSFFPSKPLGCYGDGGACFTDDENIARILKSLRAHGQIKKKYYHELKGLNSRLDTMQAAILLEKLEIFENEIDLRNKIAERYNRYLDKSLLTPIIEKHNKSVYAQYSILLKNRDAFKSYLLENKIPTMIYYPVPLSQQPVFLGLGQQACRNSLNVSREIISLPFSPYLEKNDQDYIIEKINEYLNYNRT